MTWQRYNKNLRKSALLAEYFSFCEKRESELEAGTNEVAVVRKVVVGGDVAFIEVHNPCTGMNAGVRR